MSFRIERTSTRAPVMEGFHFGSMHCERLRHNREPGEGGELTLPYRQHRADMLLMSRARPSSSPTIAIVTAAREILIQ